MKRAPQFNLLGAFFDIFNIAPHRNCSDDECFDAGHADL